jgi:hypothetical protein
MSPLSQRCITSNIKRIGAVAIKLKIDSKIEKDRVALKHLSMID